MGLAFNVAPQMADAFPDDDAPAVMATPGPTGLAPIPAVSRGAVVGPARESLAHQNRIKTEPIPAASVFERYAGVSTTS